MSEILVLLLLALLVFGPDQIPTAARTLGRAMAYVRRLTDEFRFTLEEAMREEEFERMRKEADRRAQEARDRRTASPPAVPTEPDAPPAPAARPGADPADGR